MRTRWLVLIWLLAALYTGWWSGQNPLPDGFQNESLHVGNAYDLWGALWPLDVWHMRWYMYTGYWPWGFYAVPWPALALGGMNRVSLVAGNLVHLGVLLWALRSLGRTMGAPLAPLLAVLCPAVFGTLVRFEPNLAVIAWTTAGVAFLARSGGLRERPAVLGWGACLGLGLLMDRLTVGFFLIPAVAPLLLGVGRRGLKNLALGGGLALFLTAAYYREFFLRHTGELLSQAPVGEIDAAGAISVGGGALSALYYPLVLVDSQAGPVVGALMLWGFALAAAKLVRGRNASSPEAVVLAATLAPVLFFTLIAKKQVYYTLPIVGPLAVLAAARGRVAWLGVGAGLWMLLVNGLGWDRPGFPAAPWLPEAWVAPRHTLASPPSRQHWPLEPALAALGAAAGEDGDIVAFISEDETLFEGFVGLAAREQLRELRLISIVLDPNGAYEMFESVDAMLWVGPKGGGWPSRTDIQRQLLADHVRVDQIPPVAEVVARQGAGFEETGRWTEGDVDLVVFRRVRVSGQVEPLVPGAVDPPL